MSDAVELVAAGALSRPRLVDLFNAGYEDYLVPAHVDEDTLAFMVNAFDLDLERSRVAVRGDEPAGFTLLGVRGRGGWIGGMAVVPAERRGGIGRTLMEAVLDEARAVRIDEVVLEVLEPNVPAIRLYEQLGFARTRILEVWTLEAAPQPSSATAADVTQVRGWMRSHRRFAEPWQRADDTVGRLLELGHELEAVELTGRGAALFRVAAGRVSLLQLVADDEEAASELLSAVRGRGDTLRVVNVASGDPASAALRRLGGSLDIRQLEMARTL